LAHRTSNLMRRIRNTGLRTRRLSSHACIALSVLTLPACSDELDRLPTRFDGDEYLLAADETGGIPFEYDVDRSDDELFVDVLSGDVEATFGYQSSGFGPAYIRVVRLSGAPAGHRATVQLRVGEHPVDQAQVEFVREGEAGFRTLPPFGGLLGSADPLGAFCILEGTYVQAVLTRRAADGRPLDAVFPEDVRPFANGLYQTSGVWSDQGGIETGEIGGQPAGTYQFDITSTEEDRTWVAAIRVVSEDEMVTLDVQTPAEDGIPARTIIAVLRTADGCPVVGPFIELEVDGEQTTLTSGWHDAYGLEAAEGTVLRAEWGELTSTATY